MRILLDENFPKSATDVIAAAGHEVFSFADVCEFGADDEVVFDRAQKLGDATAMVLREFRLPDGESGFHSSGLFLPGQVRRTRHFGSDQSLWRGGDWNGLVRILVRPILSLEDLVFYDLSAGIKGDSFFLQESTFLRN